MEALILELAFTIIKGIIKNPAHAATLKTQLLEIRDAINAAYPGE